MRFNPLFTNSYCNSRVVQYTASGSVEQILGDDLIDGALLMVPHCLALSPNEDTLYVADRENHRIVSFGILGNEEAPKVFSDDRGLGQLFGVAFSYIGSGGWPLYGVGRSETESFGVVINSTGSVLERWMSSQVR